MDDYLNTFGGAFVQEVLNEVRKFDMAETSWQGLDEEERLTRLAGVAERGELLAQKLVDASIADGRLSVRGTFKSAKVEGNIVCTITFPKEAEDAFSILRHQGSQVDLTVTQLAMDLNVDEATADMFDEQNAPPSWTPPGDAGQGGDDGRADPGDPDSENVG